MNRFKELNEKELILLKEAGYVVEENKEYTDEDCEKCATTISDYIMNHSKNDIPKIESRYNEILRKII